MTAMVSLERVQQIHSAHHVDLLSLPNVSLVYSGTKTKGGVDTGDPALVVGVVKKHSDSTLAALGLSPIATQIEDVPTDVIEVGILKAPPDLTTQTVTPIDNPADHQKRYRPAPGGVSAIVCGSSACTITCWVWSNAKNAPVLLHNAHCSILNNCPDNLTLQPSPFDGGKNPADAVSHVDNADFDTPQLDSAIDTVVDSSAPTMDIYGLGPYLGFGVPNVNDNLIKSGRTSGVTTGTCTALDGAANVQYPDKVRMKTDLIVTTDMLQGGDSSSPLRVVGADGKPTPPIVGQGFAGGSGIALFIKIPNILAGAKFTGYGLDFNHQFGSTPPSPPQTTDLQARVWDLTNQTFLQGASVTYNGLGVKVTDVNGLVDFGQVAQGPYTGTAAKTGYHTVSHQLNVGGTQVVDAFNLTVVTQPPPPTAQQYLALATVEQNADGSWKVDKVYFKLPVRTASVLAL